MAYESWCLIMDYKVGDKVLVLINNENKGDFTENGFGGKMNNYYHKIMTIRMVLDFEHKVYMLEDIEDIDVNAYEGWVWNFDWIKKVEV